MIKREDLKFNMPFGNFDKNQTYHMVNLIARHFRKVGQKYLMEVLLPKALTTLCCSNYKLHTSRLKGGKCKADAFMQKKNNKEENENS